MSDTDMWLPCMREELCSYLDDLRDIERLRPKFAVQSETVKSYYTLDDFVRYFYDDTDLSDDPESYIGVSLANEREVEAIRDVTNGLDRLIDRYNWSLPDRDYLDTPEWRELAKTAEAAHAMICGGCGPA